MKYYKAVTYHHIDLENSVNTHVSISGGRATHSFLPHKNIRAESLSELLNKLKTEYGDAYDKYENILYFSIAEDQWDESDCQEYYEAFITEITEIEIHFENGEF